MGWTLNITVYYPPYELTTIHPKYLSRLKEDGSNYWTLWYDQLPASCCADASPHHDVISSSSDDVVTNNSGTGSCDTHHSALYSSSCSSPLEHFVDTAIWSIIGILMGFLFINLALMTSAKMLRWSVKQEEDDFVYTHVHNNNNVSFSRRYNNSDVARVPYNAGNSRSTAQSDQFTRSSPFNSTWLWA